MLLIISTPCPGDVADRFAKIMAGLELTQDLLAQEGGFVRTIRLMSYSSKEVTTGQWSELVESTAL